jgi:hypothetical protein
MADAPFAAVGIAESQWVGAYLGRANAGRPRSLAELHEIVADLEAGLDLRWRKQ